LVRRRFQRPRNAAQASRPLALDPQQCLLVASFALARLHYHGLGHQLALSPVVVFDMFGHVLEKSAYYR
jgi:hypothetical protein